MNSRTDLVFDTGMAHAEIIEASIGSCRRWQILVFLLVFLVNFPLAMQELSITLLAPPVPFNCSDDKYDKCSPDCPSVVWDKSVFKETITIEWNLICGREWLEQFSQTILMAGIFVGNFFFGLISDRYGRRKPMIVAVFLEMITGIAVAFAPNLWLFLLLRFLVAVAAGGTLCTGFVLVVECIGRKYRSTFGILFQISYYIGHSLLGLIGYFVREWRCVQMIISIPIFFLIIYYWFLPESPRWLLSVGKYERAIEAMEKAAKVNKMPVENVRKNVMDKLEDKIPEEETFFNLFRHPAIRLKTLCICLNWIVLGLCFFGVAQYMGKIAGNIFVNISAAGLVQIPGNIIILYLIERRGRKGTLITTYIISSVAMLIITVLPSSNASIPYLGCVGMVGISLSFATAFIWSGELFATPVRNVGVGLGATCAKLGSMVAPFLIYLEKFQTWIPPLLFGITPIFAIFACLWLPETLNRSMPDSTKEAELIVVKMGSRNTEQD